MCGYHRKYANRLLKQGASRKRAKPKGRKKIYQGEVVVVEDKYGIRLTDIITPSERLNRLNSRR